MKYFRLFVAALLFCVVAPAEFKDSELKSAFTKHYQKVEVVPEVVARLAATLDKFRAWGLNPDGVAIKDFDVQFAVVFSDCPHPKVCPPARHYVAFKHVKSERVQVFDVDYIARFGTYSTAVDLVGLAKPAKED